MGTNYGHDHVELVRDIEIAYQLKSCDPFRKNIFELMESSQNETLAQDHQVKLLNRKTAH